MDDISIQIDTITKHSLNELEKKFPGSGFKLILRDFASSAHIDLLNTQLSTEILKKLPVNLIEEVFGLDTVSSQMAMLYANGKHGYYDSTISFLRELKNVPVIKELDEQVGNDYFAPWVRQKDDMIDLNMRYQRRFPTHKEFYELLKEKYTSLFNHLDQDTTIAELENVLMAAIERRYRSDAIRWHIRDAIGIQEKLAGIMDWHVKKGYDWWYSQVPSYLPEYKPRGFQLVTMTEIVPDGFDEGHAGEIGGKTIKIAGNYQPLIEQFTFTQRDDLGEKILSMDREQFERLDDSNLHMLINRRFIFPEAVELAMKYEEKTTGKKLGDLRNDPEVRAHFYGIFYHDTLKLFDSLFYIKQLLQG
jgi:hypothetical protein